MSATIIELPDRNLTDVPDGLRALARAIEAGEYADAYNVAWVIDCGDGVTKVGLLGAAPEPAPTAYFLLGLGMRRIEI